ncbi:Uncharacterized protein dnm_020790 [Desulfonema magnum]|uniref:Uncharacterized protein n=1 Tax=Desulfonema magnum TaxID=45655 RepID=A0A975BIP1_9BACT|nr:Uncharacterized protein dnm_020790 [Desulfonema magnum]
MERSGTHPTEIVTAQVEIFMLYSGLMIISVIEITRGCFEKKL